MLYGFDFAPLATVSINYEFALLAYSQDEGFDQAHVTLIRIVHDDMESA